MAMEMLNMPRILGIRWADLGVELGREGNATFSQNSFTQGKAQAQGYFLAYHLRLTGV
jgi:hypothetical protein